MKKALLLSVVASTMIMAGGDIAPVEPVVEAPVVEASGWDFNGQAALYYQTADWNGEDLFSSTNPGTRGNFGLQLGAVNKDVFSGVGFGGQVSGLATLNLENWLVGNVMQKGSQTDALGQGGWISQLYTTYAAGNTSFKLGRQELPKSLSPFAFSEGWNVFKNTFDSVLIVNTDLSNTTLVGAWVYGGNYNNVGNAGGHLSSGDMSDFGSLNGHDGVYMVTAQNKSFQDVTLTGSWYYGADMTGIDDVNILWGDAKFGAAGLNFGAQIGTVMGDFQAHNANDTVAYGAKISGAFDAFDYSLIYTGVDDGDAGVFNVGGVKTPLYSQLILNQGFIKSDNDTFVVKAGLKALGGKFGVAYDYTADNSAISNDYSEFDLTYKTKIFNGSTTLFAAYVYQNLDDNTQWGDDSRNVVRFWGRYNF